MLVGKITLNQFSKGAQKVESIWNCTEESKLITDMELLEYLVNVSDAIETYTDKMLERFVLSFTNIFFGDKFFGDEII